MIRRLPMPDIEGMFLRGLGLPSQLEEEDYYVLMGAQVRYIKEQEDAAVARWRHSVSQKW